jgi:hypothetical protein
VLGLGSYQTAWAWLHKLRRAMVLPGSELLARRGRGQRKLPRCSTAGKRGRGAEGKAIIAIAVEDHDGARGRTRMMRIADVTRQTLTDFVLDHIARETEVLTERLARLQRRLSSPLLARRDQHQGVR